MQPHPHAVRLSPKPVIAGPRTLEPPPNHGRRRPCSILLPFITTCLEQRPRTFQADFQAAEAGLGLMGR
jgi:hypothetical protein